MLDGTLIVGPPPFHANPDGISCGQCCWRMILEHFRPDGDWPFPVMDEICGAEPGKYTWTFRPVVRLSNLGLGVKLYSDFDTGRFVADAIGYMEEKFGVAGLQANLRHSNIPAVTADARRLLQAQADGLQIAYERRGWTAEDIVAELTAGRLLFTWVNMGRLNGRESYEGHFILLYGWQEGKLLAHDPGGTLGPPVAQRAISIAELTAAASEVTFGKVGTMISIGDVR